MPSPVPETRVSEFVANLTFEDLPDRIIDTITRAFVDTVGVTLAGSVESVGRKTAASAGISPDRTDLAPLLGVDTDAPPESVALRVGTASHALDYDDLSWAMDGHPSVTLVPPLLALADEAEASGRDLVTAYAAGYETECALADPISPDHYENGWHATATFGTFGATAAVAHLLGLDVDATAHALTIAASMPSGLKRNFGSMTKPLHAGLCSRSGVTAARLAREGLTADATAISGDHGFWGLYGPNERGEFSLGDRWRLREEGIHIKAYPCCYFTHTAIAATQELVEGGIDTDATERVDVTASQGAADALHHENPNTGLEGKFSMEYCVASAAVHDRVGLATFRDDAIDDPTIRRVRERVDFDVDETLPYDSHESRVRIETATGTYERRQRSPPGTHDDPLSDEELRLKFVECAGVLLDECAVDELYDVLSTLSTVEDVSTALAVET